jgi:integral membrane protein
MQFPAVPGVSTTPQSVARRRSALKRYRAIAYVVGVGLVVLVLIGVPLKYAASIDGVVAVVGPLHGVLFIVYLLMTAELAMRCRWSLLRTGLVMLAGTVPFMSFVAERIVTRDVEAMDAASDERALPSRPAPRA